MTNLEIGQRMEARRTALGLTLDDVALRVGVAKSTIQRYEKGKIEKLKQPVIEAIAAVLDIDPAWLCGRAEKMGPYMHPPAAQVVRVPVLGLVPAGIPIEAIEDIVDWEEIPAAMCSGERQYFGLRVKGDSMYPEYLDGDTIIVRKTPAFESGDVCVVYVNGFDATLKRVKVDETGAWTLIPRNPEYPPKTYTAEEVRTVPLSVAGVVVELRRKVKG